MSKRITLLKRSTTMSAADFRQHWSVPHAEIARHLPGLLRYNQNHVLRSSVSERDTEWPIHGFVELWFRDAAAIAEAAKSDTTRKLIVDEPHFLAALTGLIMDDAGLYDGPVYKIFAVDRTGVAAGKREEQLLDSFGQKTFAELTNVSSVMRRQVLASEAHPPDFVAIAGFADRAQATAAYENAVSTNKAPGLELYLTEEIRIV
jgi:uncharacterized protein (TIGR02118 family)